jgi:hypothetical protein
MASMIVSNQKNWFMLRGTFANFGLESILIIDAHCHPSPKWFEPVETLFSQMDRTGIARARPTQMLGQFDAAYQTACVAAYPVSGERVEAARATFSAATLPAFLSSRIKR